MKYAFFTGMGRSGTKFLTTLLNSTNDVHAVHEYIGNREFWLLSWYLENNGYAFQYLEKEKAKIDSRFKEKLFVDVNGYLQNSVPEIIQIFQPVKVFHFVRNPKSVVRSLYTRRNDAEIHLIPKSNDEIKLWIDGNKFSQICWNWASTTDKLLNQNTDLILFEKTISDYDYFCEKILSPLQLDISFEKWNELRSEKVNKTMPQWYRSLYSRLKGKPLIKDVLPIYTDWSSEQKKVFAEICGPVMRKCGYEL